MLTQLKKLFSRFKAAPKSPRRTQATDRDVLAETLERALLVDEQKLPTGVQWQTSKNDVIAECHDCHFRTKFTNGVERDRMTLVFEHCYGKRKDSAPAKLSVAKPRSRVHVLA
jgi:hypothetical protein